MTAMTMMRWWWWWWWQQLSCMFFAQGEFLYKLFLFLCRPNLGRNVHSSVLAVNIFSLLCQKVLPSAQKFIILIHMRLYDLSACIYTADVKFKVFKSVHHRTIQITNQMQQFFSLLSWRLFTAQRVSGVLPPIIRNSTTLVAASGFTFVSWW
jgi:hypothetical protein